MRLPAFISLQKNASWLAFGFALKLASALALALASALASALVSKPAKKGSQRNPPQGFLSGFCQRPPRFQKRKNLPFGTKASLYGKIQAKTLNKPYKFLKFGIFMV
jgi:hypothetical protein